MNVCVLKRNEQQKVRETSLQLSFYKTFLEIPPRFAYKITYLLIWTCRVNRTAKSRYHDTHSEKEAGLHSLTNWRPISLLNIDYKIVTKAFTNRTVIHDIIRTNQTGFIKCRYIGANITALVKVIENLLENNNQCLIFFLTFIRLSTVLLLTLVLHVYNTGMLVSLL